MRRFSRAIITGSLAFSLVAAAAAGTSFTVNSVEGIAIASAAAEVVNTEPCTGTYDISWEVAAGKITGFEAKRIVPSTQSDPGLAYCLDMPYALLVIDKPDDDFDVSNDFDSSSRLKLEEVDIDALVALAAAENSTSIEWFGYTDVTDGGIDESLTKPANADLVLNEGTKVLLVIGPEAEKLTYSSAP